MFPMRIAATVLGIVAFVISGCGNPDNLVLGGFNGAIITEVHSAIHGNGKVQTAPNTPPVGMSVIILSDSSDLCTKLGQFPDFFRTSHEVSTALLLFVKQDTIGTFQPGLDTSNAEMVVGQSPPDAGTPKLPAAYPAAQQVPGSFMSVSEYNPAPGGEAKGSFDIILVDPNGGGHEFVGHYKSGACPAIANVLLP
jgi:hypothetical protein